ncbi:MAG: hypothetical protein DRI54_01105 [Bacteroidetes bacterium]|nr:MAG: hypothetical protein DRI54_01105 [Bacteroidota bacterium]
MNTYLTDNVQLINGQNLKLKVIHDNQILRTSHSN